MLFGKPPNLLFLEDLVMKLDSDFLEGLLKKATFDCHKELYESDL